MADLSFVAVRETRTKQLFSVFSVYRFRHIIEQPAQEAKLKKGHFPPCFHTIAVLNNFKLHYALV